MIAPQSVELQVMRLLDDHPVFRGRVETIEAAYCAGKLVLSGRLPSFYLKQLLQEAVRHVDGIQMIDNRVVVVRSNAVSSHHK